MRVENNPHLCIEGGYMIAKVLVDNTSNKLNKVYDYALKKEDENEAQIGKRVLINFGNGRGKDKEGIIVKLILDEDYGNDKIGKLKYITKILDSESYLDESRLKLAKWISKMYFCNVYTALKLMLPQDANKLGEKKLKSKQVTVVKLNTTKDIIEKDIECKKITSAKHIKLLRQIIDTPKIEIDDIINTLGISRNIIKTVEKNGYILLDKEDIDIIDYSKIKRTTKLIPTKEQQEIIDSLINKINDSKFNVSLLLGVTGSGKTEVYLQAIEECLRLNKTAIVLVPEISLTAQTKIRFISRFGDVVSVLHSKMTYLEKQTEYKRILNGQAKIVIGPRSALFVPLKHIGLIIMDEEHDASYISQSTPRYNTKEVATYIAHLQDAVLLLGSATPEISTMYKVKTGKIDYYEMLKRPNNVAMPEIEIVDMKQELLVNKSIISQRLKEEILKNIEHKEQSFVFLNRRGFSSYIVCDTCGKTIKCPNCDVSLTYHRKNGLMLCHYCSYCETLNNICPYCGCESLKESGMGTEKVEQQLKECFPNATILRMDMDTTVKRGSHEEILDKFKKEKVDILVGTQMISKGHDIENVTLVGIINADNTLDNDYNSQEKAFSNLLQVAGRAGRGSKCGRVIMQAYDTENYVLDAVCKNSYKYFYDKEIKFRKMANYPPFIDILVIEIVGKFKDIVMSEAKKIYDIFVKNSHNIQIYSPKVPFVGKINNKYRVQILLKTHIDNKVLDLIYENLEKYDKIKNRNVNVSVIKNPVKLG